MRYLLSLFLVLFLLAESSSQAYVSGGKTRHRFAQLLVGTDFLYFPSQGETFQFSEGGSIQNFTPPASLVPRINIAGTHFWGHANFYVSIPIVNVLDNAVPDGGEINFNPGVETGLRLYPWRIERGKVRPFAGAAFAIADWKQSSPNGTGGTGNVARIPLQAGLTYQHKNWLLELGGGHTLNNELDYYTDRQNFTGIELPSTYLWLGLNYQLETTLSAEQSYLSGKSEEWTEKAAKAKALNGLSLAVGPSSAFIQGGDPRNERLYPAFGRNRDPNAFTEFGLGYYYYPWDGHLNLAYRANRSERSAYDQEQILRRRSLALEAYKFLFDYHGFVPFVGPHLSREWLELEEKVDGESVFQDSDQRWAGGITFGWDIRPNNLQSFILRTNLRYTPMRSFNQVSVSQLEFNFIQLVIYPGRGKRIREAIN